MYRGYGTAFNSAGSWSFDYDFLGIVIIFGVNNSSSSHSDNRQNNFLILGEAPVYDMEKYLYMEMYMIFQLITSIMINLTYCIFTSI